LTYSSCPDTRHASGGVSFSAGITGSGASGVEAGLAVFVGRAGGVFGGTAFGAQAANRAAAVRLHHNKARSVNHV
jgi:hypothetical protein